MSGAAQKTPFEGDPGVFFVDLSGGKKRKRHHKRGAPVKRVSRRVKGVEPSHIDVPNTPAMKKLVSKGGRSGRIYDDPLEWYFPELPSKHDLHKLLPSEEKREKNRDLFKSIESIEKDDIEDEGTEDKEDSEATHRIVNLKKIEDAVNSMCVCQCNINDCISNVSCHS